MNPRDAIIAGVAGIAAGVAEPIAATGQEETAEDPALQPIRDLVSAYDNAFSHQDLDGVMACFTEKAALMGCCPGEIWSGPDEIKAAHQQFFEGFNYGEQNFEYEFSLGEVKPDAGWGWMMTSGNVSGKRGEEEFSFPVNILLAATKNGEKWLISAMHFSTFTDQDES